MSSCTTPSQYHCSCCKLCTAKLAKTRLCLWKLPLWLCSVDAWPRVLANAMPHQRNVQQLVPEIRLMPLDHQAHVAEVSAETFWERWPQWPRLIRKAIAVSGRIRWIQTDHAATVAGTSSTATVRLYTSELLRRTIDEDNLETLQSTWSCIEIELREVVEG